MSFKLSPAQRTVAEDPHRFKVVIAGRRFGKTFLALRQLCFHARVPNKDIFYITSSYRAAKMILWKPLKRRLQDLKWIEKINESELSITLKNGSTISLKGAENPDSLRGPSLYYCVFDEVSEIEPETFFEVIRPALADQQGGALFIGTPKGKNNWSYDLFCMNQDNDAWASWQFKTRDGGFVTDLELEAAKKELDSRTYRQEFEATFETFEGRVAWAFEREHNVRVVKELDTRIIYVGVDFNVSPITAAIMTRIGDDLYVIDEILMHSSNTQELVEEVRRRYPASKVFVYPDPSGKARKTSAGGLTDHIILANAQFIVKAPNKHNSVRDRINALNSRLCSSDGIRHLFVDPKCKYTIESLEKYCYKEGTQVPDKDSGFDHIFDALSYAVDYIFPIRRDVDPDAARPSRWGHALA
jgi:phage terminase large subunit